jgi:hypothetical protein
MSDTFICYELLDISRRARFVRDEFSNVIDHLAEDLMSLVYKARKENANKHLAACRDITSMFVNVEVEGENK